MSYRTDTLALEYTLPLSRSTIQPNTSTTSTPRSFGVVTLHVVAVPDLDDLDPVRHPVRVEQGMHPGDQRFADAASPTGFQR